MSHIEHNPEICAGCKTCEAVCSLSHHGMVSPSLASMQITEFQLEGRRVVARLCRHCVDPACAAACRLNAIRVDDVTGASIIDAQACSGCKLCMEACPDYPDTTIRYDAVRKVCLKCDLCGGDPLCVKHCPEGALTYIRERA